MEGEAEWLGFGEEWKGLRSIAAVRGERIIAGKKSAETRYYISSLPGDAKKIALAVREHWAIENSLHWVLDVAFREDDCRVRVGYAAENFAVMRHIVVNLLKAVEGRKVGIKNRRLWAAWNHDFMLRVLASGKDVG